ncbi:MAG: YciI family protein [Candidatus Acidiferrales bacterium]
MEYLLLIYENEKRFAGQSEADFGAEMTEYTDFGKNHAGIIKGGNALQPTTTAKSIRVRDGKTTTTDGPFAETKEQLGGYYLVEASSVDEALKAAAKIPGARYGCVEVRPIMTFS